MEIKNTFGVPLPPDRAWSVLMDIPRIAPCMPGAELIEQVDPRTYKGRVSVRLGPVGLAFNGTARFEILDKASKRATVNAQGTDTKGRGGASATVDFQLVSAEKGTEVVVTTDVNLTGSVAQYGRASGIIQSVANQLMAQFADNLQRSLDANPENTAKAADRENTPTQRRAPPTASAAISGFDLVLRALVDSIKRLFKH